MGTFRLSVVAALMASAAPCFADPTEIARLEDSANKAMVSGEVLAGTGAAAMFAGIALLVASSWVGDDCGPADVQVMHHQPHAASHRVGGGVGGGPTGGEMAQSCGDSGLAAGGGILLILGMGGVITGSLYRDGAKRDLAEAQRLRRRLPAWSVRPSFSTTGASATVAVKF